MENTVLFVDDEKNILNALMRLFRKEGYNVLVAEGAWAGMDILRKNVVSVVVSDYRMPGVDGIELLSMVRAESPETVRCMLTGQADVNAVIEAINRGEVNKFITKPWNDEELKLAIKDAVFRHNLVAENKRLQELTKSQNEELRSLNAGLEARVKEKTRLIRSNFFAFIRIFADLLELYDQRLGGHSKRVSAMARSFAAATGLDGADLDIIAAAGLLHCVGLIGVPREILDKDEHRLTESERALLRHNPVLTQDLISSIDTLKQVGIIIRSHTERYDGAGYPDGLSKEEIHIGSRIIAICKRYDELLHARTQAEASVEKAAREVVAHAGTSFDPDLIPAFVRFVQTWKEGPQSAIGATRAVLSQRTLMVSELKPGMTLSRDIVTGKGKLLVAGGSLLTDAVIEKIRNFHRVDPIEGFVHVSWQP